jgi:hypothetical protein
MNAGRFSILTGIFGRKKVTSGIRRLQEIASQALAHKLAKEAFNEHVASRKNYQIKGRGPADKKARFEKWFSRFKKTKGLIYAFWGSHGKCIYVGRTGSHGTRYTRCNARVDASWGFRNAMQAGRSRGNASAWVRRLYSNSMN